DAPRSPIVEISAVGRASLPATQASSAQPTATSIPAPGKTLAPQPAQSPQGVQRAAAAQLPTAQQVPVQNRAVSSQPPAPQQIESQNRRSSGTAISSTYAYSNLPGSQPRLLAMVDARLPAAYLSSRAPTQSMAPGPPAPARTEQLDPVAKRMKYLAEHGTARLKAVAAFI